jgi:hypothetical protein
VFELLSQQQPYAALREGASRVAQGQTLSEPETLRSAAKSLQRAAREARNLS